MKYIIYCQLQCTTIYSKSRGKVPRKLIGFGTRRTESYSDVSKQHSK